MNPILPQRVEKIKGGYAIDHGGNRLISLTFGSGECGFLYGVGRELGPEGPGPGPGRDLQVNQFEQVQVVVTWGLTPPQTDTTKTLPSHTLLKAVANM